MCLRGLRAVPAYSCHFLHLGHLFSFHCSLAHKGILECFKQDVQVLVLASPAKHRVGWYEVRQFRDDCALLSLARVSTLSRRNVALLQSEATPTQPPTGILNEGN